MKGTLSGLLSSLNPEQAEAVRYTGGSMLLLAGAGSGKTRVLTYKYAYLVSEEGLYPSQILAVTFTNKAARQMRERVSELLQMKQTQMDVSTFHAYGLKFLSRYGNAVKTLLKRQARVVFDRGDSKSAVKKILKEQGLDPKKVEPNWVLEEISRCKREIAPPSFAYRKLDPPIGPVFERYEELLKEQNAVDFDDLLVLPLQALSSDESLREAERGRYRWILVDEYQDVNKTQYHLLKMIAGPSGKVMVVGDPDQSIYGWRGADMSMILNFEKDFPDARVFLLERNYRSTETILAAANAVIENNSKRREKALWTERDEGFPVNVLLAGNEHAEADYIAEEIYKLRDQGYKYRDMAVLYRINAMSRLYEEIFLRRGIPYRIVRGTAFYERKEIKDTIAFMRLAVNPMDVAALERIGNVPSRGLGPKSLGRLENWIREAVAAESDKIWSKLEETGAGLTGKSGKGASELGKHLRSIWKLREDVSAIVEYILKDIGYEKEFSSESKEKRQERSENIRELLSVADPAEGLESMLAEIALMTDMDLETVADADQVSMMSLHGGKGLEFPVVFIAGLEETIFPHYKCMDDPDQLEEERRLCYVGMTRAEERLYLTAARRRVLFGSMLRNGFSRFLWEIPESCKETEDRGEEDLQDAGRGFDRRHWSW